jgi:hypothetical protein
MRPLSCFSIPPFYIPPYIGTIWHWVYLDYTPSENNGIRTHARFLKRKSLYLLSYIPPILVLPYPLLRLGIYSPSPPLLSPLIIYVCATPSFIFSIPPPFLCICPFALVSSPLIALNSPLVPLSLLPFLLLLYHLHLFPLLPLLLPSSLLPPYILI